MIFLILQNNPGESIGLKFSPSQSELFRFIPISVSEPMRIIPNQSEKRFVSRFIKNGQKSIRLNPNNTETSIRINPIWDWSKPKFQSKSIRIIPTLDSFGLILIENSVWNNPSSVWFGFIWIENLVSDWFAFIRIDISRLIRLGRIDFWPFYIKRDTKRFSDWFGMIRICSDIDIGIIRNSSDWLGMNFNPILSPGKLCQIYIITRTSFWVKKIVCSM